MLAGLGRARRRGAAVVRSAAGPRTSAQLALPERTPGDALGSTTSSTSWRSRATVGFTAASERRRFGGARSMPAASAHSRSCSPLAAATCPAVSCSPARAALPQAGSSCAFHCAAMRSHARGSSAQSPASAGGDGGRGRSAPRGAARVSEGARRAGAEGLPGAATLPPAPRGCVLQRQCPPAAAACQPCPHAPPRPSLWHLEAVALEQKGVLRGEDPGGHLLQKLLGPLQKRRPGAARAPARVRVSAPQRLKAALFNLHGCLSAGRRAAWAWPLECGRVTMAGGDPGARAQH
jgi:hypothetical protein